MCLKAILRKICAIVGSVGEVTFLILSVAFHLPFIWYLKQTVTGSLTQTVLSEWIGGLWVYCYAVLSQDDQDWNCKRVDEDVAKSFGHDWSKYQTMKTFVVLSEIAGVAAFILFYIATCIKSNILNVVLIILTAFQFIAVMISSPLAQATFDEVFGQETKADWSMYLIWLCWCNSIINIALAVVVFVAGYLDD